jgi:hypothetical protein
MIGVRVCIVRFVDPHQPGFVECELIDFRGRLWRFIEKVPVVSSSELHEHSAYPADGFVACQILSAFISEEHKEVVRISTGEPWGVEAVGGESEFEVLRDMLVES